MNDVPAKIIVIDDEKRMCDSLSALLTGDGYTVDTFQSSPEAVKAIHGSKVDLVISDIKMAEMDGLEVLEAVKKVDEDIPVILMTGYASLSSALDAIAKGAYDYLLKPVEFTYLELAVKRARRLERFLTQPFFTSEHFTGKPGRMVSLEKVIDGCERIVNDEFIDFSEQALYMIGGIDEVKRL